MGKGKGAYAAIVRESGQQVGRQRDVEMGKIDQLQRLEKDFLTNLITKTQTLAQTQTASLVDVPFCTLTIDFL